MSGDPVVEAFLAAADAWVCDDYAIDLRYLGTSLADRYEVWDAVLTLNPLPAKADLSFRIDTAGFAVGQVQRVDPDKGTLLRLLAGAASGSLDLLDRPLVLPKDKPHDLFSEMSYRDRWFSELHLRITGTLRPIPSTTALAACDNALRRAQPPFDGLSDAAAWLGLQAPGTAATGKTITVRVGPPADLIFEGCALAQDQLRSS